MKLDEVKIVRLIRASPLEPAILMIGNNNQDMKGYILSEAKLHSLARDAVQWMKVSDH